MKLKYFFYAIFFLCSCNNHNIEADLFIENLIKNPEKIDSIFKSSSIDTELYMDSFLLGELASNYYGDFFSDFNGRYKVLYEYHFIDSLNKKNTVIKISPYENKEGSFNPQSIHGVEFIFHNIKDKWVLSNILY